MIFPHPTTFREALLNRTTQAILPTGMDSAMLHTLPRAIRERAVFSAGVQNVDFLERAKQAIDAISTGESNRATERTALRELAEQYDLPALQKDGRLNLFLDTQVKMSRGFGSWVEGQHPSVLMMWPAQEFYRAEDRKEPRDWPARWEEAGGQFFDGESDYPEGRMVALKSDSIWEEISAFGLPYDPFDYNSGMSLRDIDRDEAVDLGLMDEDDEEDENTVGMNQGLRASIGIAGNFGLGMALGEFLAGIATIGRDGVVRFIGAGS